MSEYDFEYTKHFDPNSSLVDDVYFNENDDSVVLDLNDELYRYTGVKVDDVAELVSANSTGAHYNKVFKHKFGPAEHLGHYDDVYWPKNPAPVEKSTPGTPKGLVDKTGDFINSDGSASFTNVGATREFSLGPIVSEADVSAAPVAEATKEFSLNLPDEGIKRTETGVGSTPSDISSIVVHFTLKGYDDRKFKFVAEDALNSDEAIDELNEYVSRIGVVGKVRKVVVKFD